MTDIFIESMLNEQTQFLESVRVEIEEAKFALLESMNPSPFFEAESEGEQKSGGIFQAILRLLKAVIRAIRDGFKKIGNWITGAKVTPEGQNAKIQGMDPNVVVKLVDGDIADASDALRRAAEGKMTIEEAKAFIDKKEAVWKTLQKSALPIAGLVAFFIGKRFTVDKWIAEANGAMDTVEELNRKDGQSGLDSKLASVAAHTAGDQNRKNVAKSQASQLIADYMGRSARRGLDFLMSPIRESFQKGYIERKILNDAKLMGTEKGRKKLAERDRQRVKNIQAETKATKRYGRNVNKASAQGNRSLDRRINAADDLNKAQSEVFDNVERNKDRVPEHKNALQRAAGAVMNKLKR